MVFEAALNLLGHGNPLSQHLEKVEASIYTFRTINYDENGDIEQSGPRLLVMKENVQGLRVRGCHRSLYRALDGDQRVEQSGATSAIFCTFTSTEVSLYC